MVANPLSTKVQNLRGINISHTFHQEFFVIGEVRRFTPSYTLFNGPIANCYKRPQEKTENKS